MSLFESASREEKTIQIYRLQPDEYLGTAIPRQFLLDGHTWPTAEHYYQGTKYPGRARAEDIRAAPTADQARKLGRGWLKRPRKDWEKLRVVVMTRAIYTQCHTWPDFAKALLDTGETPIVEISLYDYFWGTGRDHRGTNQYGKVLMDVRQKLREEIAG